MRGGYLLGCEGHAGSGAIRHTSEFSPHCLALGVLWLNSASGPFGLLRSEGPAAFLGTNFYPRFYTALGQLLHAANKDALGRGYSQASCV